MNEKNLSTAIKELRAKAGVTQTELAIKLGVKNVAAVSTWERGGTRPGPQTIVRMIDLADSVDASNLARIFRGELEKRLGASVGGQSIEPRLQPIFAALTRAAQDGDEQTLKRVESVLRSYTQSKQDNKKDLNTGKNSGTIGNTRSKKLA